MNTLRSAIVTLIAVAMANCRASDEAVGATSEEVTVTIAPTEASVSVIRTNATAFAMAYDDAILGSRMGWAFSTNSGSTWTKCNAAGTCGAVTPPPGQTGGTAGWLGAPAIVSDGAGHAFYVTLSDMDNNTGNGAEGVTVAISNNGGASFASAQIVNSDTGSTCNAGTQDQPYATIDKDTLVVAWRHKNSGDFGGCIKRAHIDISGGTASLNWGFFGNLSHSISNMDQEGASGQGGLLVQARGDGTGVLTVVYSNNDQYTGCPSAALSSIGWGSVTSYDGGVNWTSHTQIVHSTTFQGCMIRGSVKIQNVLRAFGFVWSQFDSHQYVAINDSRNTIRLYVSGNEGNSWREFCGGTIAPTWSVTGGTCATAFVVGADTTSTHFVAMPTLATTTHGGLALLNYESEPGAATLRTVFRGDSTPLDPAAFDWQPAVGTSTTVKGSIGVPTTSSAFLLGNYISMAALPPDACTFSSTTFLPAWIQASAKKQQVAVATVTLNP